MHVSRRAHRARRRQAHRAGQAGLAAAAVTCACLAVFAGAGQAQDDGLSLQLSISVVAPSGTAGPRPTGTVRVSVDGRRVLSLTLGGGLARLTSITPQLTATLTALGHRVTISY